MKLVLTRDQFDNIQYETEGFDADVEFRIHYSGRGMYGTECVGVIARDPNTPTAFLAIVAKELDMDFLDLLSELHGEQDSMGRSTITYWRDLTVEGDDE